VYIADFPEIGKIGRYGDMNWGEILSELEIVKTGDEVVLSVILCGGSLSERNCLLCGRELGERGLCGCGDVRVRENDYGMLISIQLSGMRGVLYVWDD
jgi:hypothetical protein